MPRNANEMANSVAKLGAIAIIMLLGSTLYRQYMDSSPFIVDGDMVSIKNVIHQLAKGLKDLNVKNELLQGEIEKMSSKLPALEHVVSRSKSDIGAPYFKKNRYDIDIKNYDWQINDFALESAGGRILNTGKTQPHVVYDSHFSWIMSLMANALCRSCEEARAILQPSVLPGECWAFKGSRGEVTIQLLGRIEVTGLSLEHIPPNIAPTKEISPAPRKFSLEGLENPKDKKGHAFGTFEYNLHGKPIQYFEVVSPSNHFFNIVKMKIFSNWGNPTYTCVYRVRIHGELAPGEAAISS